MTQREFTDKSFEELKEEIRIRADEVWSTCPEEWLTEETLMGLKIGLWSEDREEAEFNEAVAGIPQGDYPAIRSRIESRMDAIYGALEDYAIECFER